MAEMSSASFIILIVLLVFIGLCVGWLFWLSSKVRHDVEDALKNATTEEQEVIRKKVVRAVFPPRFPKD